MRHYIPRPEVTAQSSSTISGEGMSTSASASSSSLPVPVVDENNSANSNAPSTSGTQGEGEGGSGSNGGNESMILAGPPPPAPPPRCPIVRRPSTDYSVLRTLRQKTMTAEPKRTSFAGPNSGSALLASLEAQVNGPDSPCNVLKHIVATMDDIVKEMRAELTLINAFPGKNLSEVSDIEELQRRLVTSERANHIMSIHLDLLELQKKLEQQEAKNLEEKKAFVTSAREELYKEIVELLEAEFSCSICNEVFVQPSVTRCGHTFCELCIATWNRDKKDCPICRAHVPTLQWEKHVEMDNFITRLHLRLSDEIRESREALVGEKNRAVEQLRASRPAVSGPSLPPRIGVQLPSRAPMPMPRRVSPPPPPSVSCGSNRPTGPSSPMFQEALRLFRESRTAGSTRPSGGEMRMILERLHGHRGQGQGHSPNPRNPITVVMRPANTNHEANAPGRPSNLDGPSPRLRMRMTYDNDNLQAAGSSSSVVDTAPTVTRASRVSSLAVAGSPTSSGSLTSARVRLLSGVPEVFRPARPEYPRREPVREAYRATEPLSLHSLLENHDEASLSSGPSSVRSWGLISPSSSTGAGEQAATTPPPLLSLREIMHQRSREVSDLRAVVDEAEAQLEAQLSSHRARTPLPPTSESSPRRGDTMDHSDPENAVRTIRSITARLLHSTLPNLDSHTPTAPDANNIANAVEEAFAPMNIVPSPDTSARSVMERVTRANRSQALDFTSGAAGPESTTDELHLRYPGQLTENIRGFNEDLDAHRSGSRGLDEDLDALRSRRLCHHRASPCCSPRSSLRWRAPMADGSSVPPDIVDITMEDSTSTTPTVVAPNNDPDSTSTRRSANSSSPRSPSLRSNPLIRARPTSALEERRRLLLMARERLFMRRMRRAEIRGRSTERRPRSQEDTTITISFSRREDQAAAGSSSSNSPPTTAVVGSSEAGSNIVEFDFPITISREDAPMIVDDPPHSRSPSVIAIDDDAEASTSTGSTRPLEGLVEASSPQENDEEGIDIILEEM